MSGPFDVVPLLIAAPLLGAITGGATAIGTRRLLLDCEVAPKAWPRGFGILGAVLGTAFVWAVMRWHTQETPEVRPEEFWRQLRVFWHLVLLVLLLWSSATDLLTFSVFSWICWLGLAIGVAGAGISGDFQLAHLWIDWNAEQPQLVGPEFPDWLPVHPHLHGLAWSLSGALCGAGLTWIVRQFAAWLLGRPALGSGDVLLMAMIGAFLGWQPVSTALLLAPVLAVLFAGLSRFGSHRTALPFGPFLAVSAMIVLTFWRSIWMAEFTISTANPAARSDIFAVRRFFGDPISLAIVAGVALCLLCLLLGLLRLYHAIPVASSRRARRREQK